MIQQQVGAWKQKSCIVPTCISLVIIMQIKLCVYFHSGTVYSVQFNR